ncbi:MAG TPA: CpXC domain-containing protein [Rectinemataceae bacterium]|nr:CpXC domain-containing protein [Rectinemataceae bacterium]
MRTVTCICEFSFDADLPDEIDLDAEPQRLKQILDRSFFTLTCPSCGTRLEPELKVRLLSRSRDLDVVVLPELERMSFYRGKVALPKSSTVLVGFPELRERARMYSDGLDPDSVEIIKYFLLVQAEERSPEAEISLSYGGKSEESLDFHASGIKTGETAVLHVNRTLYEQTRTDKARTMRSEPFDRIFGGPYRSLRALEIEEE